MVSSLYNALSSIKGWGRRPSEFGLCAPEEDLEVMVAYDNTSAEISEVING